MNKNIALNRRNLGLLLILSLSLSITVFALLRCNIISSGKDIDVDVFYHVRMASLFPDACITKHFPWTQLSVWKDGFCDKELGFHAILRVFAWISDFFGLPCTPPFNLISTMLASFVLITYSLYAWLKKTNFCFLVPLLLISVSPLFLLRLSMVRPQLISIALFGLVLFLLSSKASEYVKIICLFFLSWLYSISYSSPQVVIAALVASAAADLIISRSHFMIKIHFYHLLAFAAGLVTGMTLHPQYPNTFYLWYVQGIMVVRKILGAGMSVTLGDEAGHASITTVLENLGVYALFFTALLQSLFSREKDKTAMTFMVAGGLMLAGFFFSERCIEYAMPSVITAFVYSAGRMAGFFRERIKTGLLAATAGITLLAAMAFHTSGIYFNYVTSAEMAPCYNFGSWAKSHVRTGVYIGQIRWGEFPRLFYVAPQYRYSMALDPMFTYAAYPEKAEALDKFVYMKKMLSPGELASILGTNLVFISSFDILPARYLASRGAIFLYSGDDGWLIKL